MRTHNILVQRARDRNFLFQLKYLGFKTSLIFIGECTCTEYLKMCEKCCYLINLARPIFLAHFQIQFYGLLTVCLYIDCRQLNTLSKKLQFVSSTNDLFDILKQNVHLF